MLKRSLKLVCAASLSFILMGLSSTPVFAEDNPAQVEELSETASESSQPDPGPTHNVGTDGASADDYGVSLMSVSPLARTSGNTWTKNGSTYTATDGTVVTNAKAMGIDVSQWQGSINWAQVKQSGLIDYAIIRCGYGNDNSAQDDTQFINNVRGCLDNGIPFGVYIYSYAFNTSMATSEANHVLRMLESAGLDSSKVGYPIYLDLEYQGKGSTPAGVTNGQIVNVSNAGLAQIAQTFCSIIENHGYQAGVYANLNWWNNFLTDSVFSNWSKWVAQYNTHCDYTGSYDMWQCMSDGLISGISGNVDCNFDLVGLENVGAGQTTWSRVYGQDQLDTMQQISQTGWSSSQTVVIATDNTYWDALTASALAGVYDCPILLTHGGTLSPQTKAEIQRLGAKTAYVCGGPLAIATAVDNQIKAAGCTNVVRVYGQDQQGTAREIAKRVQAAAHSDTCIIATSQTFQDSLSISPYAYSSETPIFLCDSGSNSLSSSTLASIREGGYSKAVIVGGPIAVSSTVESQLQSAGISSIERRYGQTEYETSKSIAEWELTKGMSVNGMAVATGTTFYDALAGSALCGKNNAVIVIASDYNRICLTDFIASKASSINKGYVFGGPIAVSQSTWNVLMKSYLY